MPVIDGAAPQLVGKSFDKVPPRSSCHIPDSVRAAGPIGELADVYSPGTAVEKSNNGCFAISAGYPLVRKIGEVIEKEWLGLISFPHQDGAGLELAQFKGLG